MAARLFYYGRLAVLSVFFRGLPIVPSSKQKLNSISPKNVQKYPTYVSLDSKCLLVG